MTQKLVSIYLTYHLNYHTPDIQEHLNDYLGNGWTIAQVTMLNGAGGGKSEEVSGWIVVLLQK